MEDTLSTEKIPMLEIRNNSRNNRNECREKAVT
jgi:hypothetical protein